MAAPACNHDDLIIEMQLTGTRSLTVTRGGSAEALDSDIGRTGRFVCRCACCSREWKAAVGTASFHRLPDFVKDAWLATYAA